MRERSSGLATRGPRAEQRSRATSCCAWSNSNFLLLDHHTPLLLPCQLTAAA